MVSVRVAGRVGVTSRGGPPHVGRLCGLPLGTQRLPEPEVSLDKRRAQLVALASRGGSVGGLAVPGGVGVGVLVTGRQGEDEGETMRARARLGAGVS